MRRLLALAALTGAAVALPAAPAHAWPMCVVVGDRPVVCLYGLVDLNGGGEPCGVLKDICATSDGSTS